MKLPDNFPEELNGKKLFFATQPKCFSAIYDIEDRVMLAIKYYAIAESDKNSGVRLLSMDNSFSVISDSFFLTIDEAMYELEADNISEKDWKRIDSINKGE